MTERTRREGVTPLQNVRIERSLWRRLGRAAAKNGSNRSTVLRQFALWYVHESGASMPSRPETPTPPLPEDE